MMLKMLGINERHVCACVCVYKRRTTKGQWLVSDSYLDPPICNCGTFYCAAKKRSPALHSVYKVLYCMPCIAKGETSDKPN